MSCFAEAMRLDLRRNALWMALAALLIFLLAPLAGMFAQMTARQTARAVEAASALAGVAALCGLFFPERERGVREAVAAQGVPLWTVWAARAVWLLVALWVSSCAAALLLEAQGSEISRRMALAGFANAAFTGGLAALCAGPILLGRWGLLDGRQAVSYPTRQDQLGRALVLPEARAVLDGKFVTGHACGSSFDFGLKIVEALRGREAVKIINDRIFYHR